MSTKYGVERLSTSGGTRLHVNIMLLPEPNSDASTSTTRFKCCYGGPGTSVRFAQIPYLTPSHPNWTARPAWGGLQQPPDDYHAHYLVHEFSHAAQHTIWGSQRPVPTWVSEGLAEYDGMFHTTEYSRTAGFNSLVRYVHNRIPDRLYCCQTAESRVPTFGSTDVYFGGSLILKYLADTFGEEIHVRLVRHQYPSFAEVLAAEIEAAGTTVPEAFEDLKTWLNDRYDAL